MRSLRFSLVLLAFIISIISCEVDRQVFNTDPIIGQWQFVASYTDDEKDENASCEDQTLLTLNGSGIFNVNTFLNAEGICLEDPRIVAGNWKNIGDKHYKLSYIDNDQIANLEYAITLNDSVMTWIYSKPNELLGKTEIHSYEYLRIE